jgi:putative ABC transport system permease protein
LGRTVAQRLFERESPLGRVVRIRDIPFAVIGVLAPKGKSSTGRDQDDKVMIPLSTAGVRLMGTRLDAVGGLRYIMVKVDRAQRMEAVQAELRRLLRQRHRLAPGYPDDFTVSNLAEIQAQ